MQCRALLPGLLACGILFLPRPVQATTITQNTVADFQPGIADGTVVQMGFVPTGPGSGAVGVMPKTGAPIITEDFDKYTSQAQAETGGWLFTTPNPGEHTELATNPTSVDFTANPGSMRIHASRAQDFWGLGAVGQRSPFLALWSTPVNGDFIAETKVTFPNPRMIDNRTHGLVVLQAQPTDLSNGKLVQFTMDENTSAVMDGLQFIDHLINWNWTPTGALVAQEWAGWPGQSWYLRVVKHGAYYFVYAKNADSGPWVFENFFKMPNLVGTNDNPVVIGLLEKSWGGVGGDATQYSDTDYDYLHVYQLGSDSGTYSNVMDAKQPVNWRTFSLNTDSKEGTKYQLRTGNTLSGGTLTDAGSFVGPDGTSSSYFVDESYQPIPNGQGKRYLEYKLFLTQTTTTFPGQTAPNLPGKVRSVSADYEAAGLGASLDTASAFKANTGGLDIQSGGGDVSNTRTQVFMDDFNSSTLDSAWTFDPGQTTLDPTVVGDYSLTDRPGWLRVKVGYPQDFFTFIKQGGIKILHPLPAGANADNVEIETEVNMETQASRMAMLMLWQDENNYTGITVSRRDPFNWQIGVTGEPLLHNDTPFGVAVDNYGTNDIFLRVSKVGQIVTLSYRDAADPSPAWHVLHAFSTAGQATGNTDFAPTQMGFMAKSYGSADPNTQNYDFAYMKVSSLAPTGTQTVNFTIPAGAKPESLIPQGDDIAGQVKFQVDNGTGTLVGPDGTSSSYFTTYEPKLPDSLASLSSVKVAATLDASTGGVAYLKNLGVQYVTPGTAVAHDTTKADFGAATVQNGVDITSLPGVVTPTISSGTPQQQDFNSAPSDWVWSNNPPGTSSYSFTTTPGNAELNCVSVTDLWGAGTSDQKPRAVLYQGTPVTGDFEIETHMTMPDRGVNRHQGLAIIQANPTGTTADNKLNLENMIVFGPYQPDGIRMMHADNNGFADGDGAVTGETGTDYYLRLRKVGRAISGAYSSDGTNWTAFPFTFTFSHDLPSMYVGFSAKAWPGSMGTQTMDFDYLKFTPLSTTGALESRVLDLGTTGLYPMLTSLGGNSAAATLQFRAADDPSALAALPYVGPDGTANSSYSATFTGTIAGMGGKRYIQYKAGIPVGSQLSDVMIVGQSSTVVPLSAADALRALAIAGGLQTASSADITRLNLVPEATATIDMKDAAAILRKVSGL